MELEYTITVNGKKFPVYTQTGQVVSSKKYSQTTVHGNANDVKSTVHTFNEVWIKFINGNEHRFVFPSGKVETREGQYLTVLAAENNKIVAILNHNTNKYEFMDKRSLFQIYPAKNSGCFLKFFLGVGISALGIWSFNEFGNKEYLHKNSIWVLSLLSIPALIGIYRSFSAWNKELNEENEIKKLLTPLVNEIFEDVLTKMEQGGK